MYRDLEHPEIHTKICNKCGEELLVTEFYKDPRRGDGVRSICKACWSKRKKEYSAAHKERISENGKRYYRANKERIDQRIRKWKKDNHEEIMERQRARRKSASELLLKLKTPCVKCGETRMWVIQFHHIDHTNKEFELSTEVVSHKKLGCVQEEAKKCACLCANCHTEFHYFFGKNPTDPIQAFDKYLGGAIDEAITRPSGD